MKKNVSIRMADTCGDFCENKDEASRIRQEILLPALSAGNSIILDFEKVEGATQSFIHALISDIIRKHGIDIIEEVTFKGCNETVKKIIEIVIQYMQESTQ